MSGRCLASAGVLVTAGLLALTRLADGQLEMVPGADAIFAGRGVAILWGVVLGPDETRTQVVLRIERLDPGAPWRLVSVEAVDSFSGQREWVRLAADLGTDRAVTVEMSRESFVAKP
ncbi:MAG TPA: hypothetical protein VGW35_06245, partial [Methylomirabilota bacterium]|nr:hypothetical protein [Methylomirabilota bacterium]